MRGFLALSCCVQLMSRVSLEGGRIVPPARANVATGQCPELRGQDHVELTTVVAGLLTSLAPAVETPRIWR